MSHELKIFYGLIGFLLLGRFHELWLTRRNSKVWLDELGGHEVGVGLRKIMIIFHASWFLSLIIEANLHGMLVPVRLQVLCFSLLLIAQFLRFHSMSLLGNLWSTRIYQTSHFPVCREGLFKWVRHPNYLAVILEFVAVPLQLELWWTLYTFSFLNFIFLFYRMKIEDRVLGQQAAKWRMIPGVF